METTKKRSQYFKYIRHLHRILAPIMLFPLLLTTITGIIYQIKAQIKAARSAAFIWALCPKQILYC
ncbi:hypothetical protein APA_3355 [Pseudanabaena sp. lw0831]|uniref:hypothetical protein n=1 Tax=Pseudanabaena sp. lw0831 TaxID=1357935 RepID=UPI0019169A5D|nr:hypothetical protein [Pseudanabaena sp. lw0831]GBO55305.1 hypothetical protein APA_3355 [Pseudanabaena sp. lw0831]